MFYLELGASVHLIPLSSVLRRGCCYIHAFVFSYPHLFKFRSTLTFLGMGAVHSSFGGGWRVQYQHSSS